MDKFLLETLEQAHLREQFDFIPKVTPVVRMSLKKKGVDPDFVIRKVQPQAKKFVAELKRSGDSITGVLMRVFYELVVAIKEALSSKSFPISTAVISAIIFLIVVQTMTGFVTTTITLLLLSTPIITVTAVIDMIIRAFKLLLPDQKAKVLETKKRMESAISAAISS